MIPWVPLTGANWKRYVYRTCFYKYVWFRKDEEGFYMLFDFKKKNVCIYVNNLLCLQK